MEDFCSNTGDIGFFLGLLSALFNVVYAEMLIQTWDYLKKKSMRSRFFSLNHIDEHSLASRCLSLMRSCLSLLRPGAKELAGSCLITASGEAEENIALITKCYTLPPSAHLHKPYLDAPASPQRIPKHLSPNILPWISQHGYFVY